MPITDTIAAIATAPGAGAIGVVRVSGPAVPKIAGAMLGHPLPANQARYLKFRGADGRVIDQGIALQFVAPHSFTGEAVLELQAHGGPVVLKLLLNAAVQLGARVAKPGEFSERAFLNDKLDLAQAEAIADLISSATEAAARAAARSLAGEFSTLVHHLAKEITRLRSWVESAIDFPTDEIDFLSGSDTGDQLRELSRQLTTLQERTRQGRLLRDGVTLAIVGPPNAGKSSLLNTLSGRDSAIVTPIPGTTRDVLREQIALDGIPLHLVDTAGLRDATDQVEREGVRRALAELHNADHILLISDVSDPAPLPHFPQTRTPVTQVCNKIDLTDDTPRLDTSGPQTKVFVSIKTGAGLDLLKTRIKAVAGADVAVEGQFLARARHVAALDQVAEHLALGLERLEVDHAGELLAEELRLAQQMLGEITGTVSTEDLLGEIFAGFCIGK